MEFYKYLSSQCFRFFEVEFLFPTVGRTKATSNEKGLSLRRAPRALRLNLKLALRLHPEYYVDTHSLSSFTLPRAGGTKSVKRRDSCSELQGQLQLKG